MKERQTATGWLVALRHARKSVKLVPCVCCGVRDFSASLQARRTDDRDESACQIHRHRRYRLRLRGARFSSGAGVACRHGRPRRRPRNGAGACRAHVQLLAPMLVDLRQALAPSLLWLRPPGLSLRLASSPLWVGAPLCLGRRSARLAWPLALSAKCEKRPDGTSALSPLFSGAAGRRLPEETGSPRRLRDAPQAVVFFKELLRCSHCGGRANRAV